MKFKINDKVTLINEVEDKDISEQHPKINDIGIVSVIDEYDDHFTYKITWFDADNKSYNWWVKESNIEFNNKNLTICSEAKNIRAIYDELLLAGFTEEQSMKLMIATINGGK